MTDIVDVTLKKWRQSRFSYGSTDCLLSINDYIVSRPGRSGRSEAIPGRAPTGLPTRRARAYVNAYGGPQGLAYRPLRLPAGGLIPAKPGAAISWCLIRAGRGGDTLGAICTGDGIAAGANRTKRYRIEPSICDANARLEG